MVNFHIVLVLLVLFITVIVIAGYYLINTRIIKKRRQSVIQQPVPKRWRRILEKNLPLYVQLPKELKRRLHEKIQLFLTEKNFEGCAGLKVTEEMMVTIAGQACFLVTNQGLSIFPKLRTILIYPSSFQVNKSKSLFHLVDDEEGKDVLLGESWSTGSVILAWDNVLQGGADDRDGHNLVLHEFAHQLDQLDGEADGAPVLKHASHYANWARVLGGEYEDLHQRLERGAKTDFDAYGATNPAEFFAVVTESFFEKAKKMRRKHPELYQELKSFYELDPAEWK